MRYYTLRIDSSEPTRWTDWDGLCEEVTRIVAAWLEVACLDRWIPDTVFNRIDAQQMAFVRREQTFQLPYKLVLPATGDRQEQVLLITGDTLEINQVVLFEDSKAGHLSATGGEGPWPVISDVPGEWGEVYWLDLGEFTPTPYGV